MEKNKRFEDWEEVSCNDCAHYWQDACDGAPKGSRVGCNSYLATRSIVIPEKIKKLERRTEWLEWATGLVIAIMSITLLVGCLIG